MRTRLLILFFALLCSHCGLTSIESPYEHATERPATLIEDMDEGPLKDGLKACSPDKLKPSDLVIGHRGAPLYFPEHTRESYIAAAHSGAGVIECDVTFTRDKVLVCRHSQCDLHTSTDILDKPELAKKCSTPFQPANPVDATPAQVECCTSDISLAEFKTLRGKMDGFNPMATGAQDYMRGPKPGFERRGTLMTHAESIQLFQSLGVKMAPELKAAQVEMPYQGMTQADYAASMIDEYQAAGVPARDVFPQSFQLTDVLYWIQQRPAYGRQAMMLDGRYNDASFNIHDSSSWRPDHESLQAKGVNIIAPPLWMLLQADDEGRLRVSEYAVKAKAAGLDIITWTLERSGSLKEGGGWYYQGLESAINNDGDVMHVIDTLVQELGVIGIFTDWPATVSYYLNCMINNVNLPATPTGDSH